MSKHPDEIISENEFWYDGKHYEARPSDGLCLHNDHLCALWGAVNCVAMKVHKQRPPCCACETCDSQERLFIETPAPTARKPAVKRKVAKCEIVKWDKPEWSWYCDIAGAECNGKAFYTSRSHAIRGARRFCARIGHECEIVEETK